MRKQQTEMFDQAAKRKKTNRDCIMRTRQTETSDQAAKHKKTKQDCMKRQRQTETNEQGTQHKKTDCDFKRRKCEEIRYPYQNDSKGCNGDDMTNVIDRATKEAKKNLHRTRDPANPHQHRATVCIICDCFIIGIETIHELTKEDICAHSKRLGVKSYEEYYQTTLNAEVKNNTKYKVYKICYCHHDQGNIPMVMPPVLSVTLECNHRWHLRKLLPNLPLQMDL